MIVDVGPSLVDAIARSQSESVGRRTGRYPNVQLFREYGVLNLTGRELTSMLEGALAWEPEGPAPLCANDDGALPVTVQVSRQIIEPGESRASFRARGETLLGECADSLKERLGVEAYEFRLLSAGLSATMTPGQVVELQRDPGLTVSTVDLNDLVVVTELAAAGTAMGMPRLENRGDLDGRDVRVGIVDSGIDKLHPNLVVTDSVSTCDEPDTVPGLHGTHVAGCVASRDADYSGVAPGCELVNLKALRSTGATTRPNVIGAFEQAQVLEVDILVVSLGWNHLPKRVHRGNAWPCRDGLCELCIAVRNLVQDPDHPVLVVTAAGNDHRKAEELRAAGHGHTYDTEISCPGQSSASITVGSLDPLTWAPAGTSSSGPTSFGAPKPDLSAYGVNITSTTPVPRDTSGEAAPSTRQDRFIAQSGTSMATPLVAGVLALLLQRARERGEPTDPESLRVRLMTTCVEALAAPVDVVGKGRLVLPVI